MKCAKCGNELAPDDLFCRKCGTQVQSERVYDQEKLAVPKPERRKLKDTIREKFAAFWHSLDFFNKTVFLSALLCILLFVVAVCSEHIWPIVFSILQIIGIAVAFLMHRDIIHIKKLWLKYFVLIAAILISAANVKSYSWKKQAATTQNSIATGNKSSSGIGVPTEGLAREAASVFTPCSSSDCYGKEYTDVQNKFTAAGFNVISITAIYDLNYDAAEKKGLVESVSVDKEENFSVNQEYSEEVEVIISYHDIQKNSPPLSSAEAKTIAAEELDEMFNEVGFADVTISEVFDLDPNKMTADFETEVSIGNTTTFSKDDSFQITDPIRITTHRAYETYSLKVIINFISNLFFNKYDVELELNGEKKLLSHGQDAELDFRLKPGEYPLDFSSVDSSSVKGQTSIELTGDTVAAYTIICNGTDISVKTDYVENRGAVGEGQAMVPISANDCMGKLFTEVEQSLADAGFTDISTTVLYDIVWGLTRNGAVKQVSIDGNDSFIRGNIFEKDAKIMITYHMPESDNPDKPDENQAPTSDQPDKTTSISYSTNDSSTVKNGNSGVYAYVNRGQNYYLYYIIDFDEGYVYYFTDGNENGICDKVKIVSGNLNDVLIITYHDGGDTWSYGLHFKWKNQPDHLILQEASGIEYDYYGTDLSSALKIMAEKTVIEY